MTARPTALVIGGSIGGLTAAALLGQIGWDATVYERSPGDLSGRGAGLAISEELVAVMRRIGARFDGSIGASVASYAWLDRSGAVRYEYRRAIAASAWSRVYRPLRAAFPDARYRGGMSLESVRQDDRGVTARFADGTQAEGDLLVAADGVLSTVRRQFLPRLEPRYAGYVAWRGLVDAAGMPEATHRLVGRRNTFNFPPGELALAMPAPAGDADAPGKPAPRRYYFIWYRPTSPAALAQLCTDATGRAHGTAIAPPLIRAELVRALKDEAAAVFAPGVAAIVAGTREPMLQAITDLATPQMVWGRVALLGDAAFVARPHVAAGTSKAGLDALALSEALAALPDDVPAALARYAQSQAEFGNRLVAHGRYLGGFLEAEPTPEAAALGRDPQRLMHEYGAPQLVHDVDLTRFEA